LGVAEANLERVTASAAFLDEDLDNRLLKERIVFLSGEVRDENTMKLHKQLLLLSAADPEADIYLHIHSPGGSVDAGMMVYDTMNYIRWVSSCSAQAPPASASRFRTAGS
jgi:ATP-dependent Clp endopeptidase proteolytic subunit ClpP